ncbi:MAG: hypothetical protein JWP89_5676 [Schlesneria sp.]|nr:hypothetical protein [Schlesneria sp.]
MRTMFSRPVKKRCQELFLDRTSPDLVNRLEKQQKEIADLEKKLRGYLKRRRTSETKLIPYIGDISREDAIVLSQFAATSAQILEFGVGASTQVLRAYSTGKMISVDTSLEWIERTKSNLALLGITSTVDFRTLSSIPCDSHYDFVFVDGVDELRLPFAISSWSALVPGGHLMFHDTRRHRDFLYVTHLASMCAGDVESLTMNCNQSNISIVKRRLRPIGSGRIFPDLEKLLASTHTADVAPIVAVWGPNGFATRIREQIGTPVFTISKHSENTQVENASPDRLCDLIIIDESNEWTLFELMDVWNQLRNGGYLLIRDLPTLRNTIQLAIRHWLEVDSVHPNWDQSDYSLLRKKAAEPYVNWNEVEERKAWETGHGEPDGDAIKSRLTGLRSDDQ